MRLAEAPVAAREATTVVAIPERASQGRRDRARLGADVDDAPVGIVLHHHAARFAAKALGRFRGNAPTVFDDRLAGLLRIVQDRGVDVHAHLVVLGRRAWIDPVVQYGL